ncbi:MAG TPA: helix-turn-helix transcriptional regulator [Luteolibacter sp.]
MASANGFERIAALLTNELCKQSGAVDITIFELDEDFRVSRVIGEGLVTQRLRTRPGQLNEWASEAPSEAIVIESEDAREARLLERTKRMGASDFLSASLIRGKFRSAWVGAWRVEGKFSGDECERFHTAVLIAHAALKRIEVQRFDQRALENIMHIRREAHAAFLLRNGRAIPYNPTAVAYADTVWGKDDVEFVLSEASVRALDSAIAKTWSSPVDPHWVTVEIDLGGGMVRVGALVRPDGGVLILFAPPARQSVQPQGTVPMLTRRQCDIMDWIAEGKTSAEVAIILEISPRTVEKHLEAIFQRFGVENRVAAVRSYLEAKGGLPVN